MYKVLVGETEILGEKTSYFLLEEIMGVIENYGVEIVWGMEQCCIRGITVSGDRAWHLIELLMYHSVTPIALRDVIDDWLLGEN